MPGFRFYHPVEVRYGDLDPQGHLNNARYLTFMEQARIQYFLKLGLWNGGSFLSIGIILADVRVTFLAPVLFGQPVQVGAGVTRLGTRSLDMEHVIEDAGTGQELATGSSVLVAYDYHQEQTMPIPDRWRQAIRDFEGLTE